LETGELSKVIDWMLKTRKAPAGVKDETKEQTLAKVMAQADSNGDGKLDCPEFIRLFQEVVAGLPISSII